MDKVSIIVPVYNVELYLKECIDSIISQDYTNIEIILVDDGSLDESGSICDTYEMKYNNIITVHKKNGGLSDARNVGINVASGDYLCFVDGDDYIEPTYVSSMLEHMNQTSCLISACGFCRVYDNGKKEFINRNNICQEYKGQDAQKYLNIQGYYNVSACNKLFKAELFADIKFPIGKNSEDCFVMYRLLELSGGIYYDSSIKYYYRQRNGSISKSTNINYHAVEAASNVYSYYKKKQWKIALPYAAQMAVMTNIGAYNGVLCNSDKYDRKELDVFRKNAFDYKADLTLNGLPMKRKIQVALFWGFEPLYKVFFKVVDIIRTIKYRKF